MKQEEMDKEKYENLDKMINKNVDKLKPAKANKQISTEDYSDDDDDSIVSDKTEYDYNNIMSKIYGQNYKFDYDDDILNSLSKIFKEYDMEYNPRPNTTYYRVRYLLNKLKGNKNIPVDIHNHFHTTLSENNKAYHIIPIEKNEQTGFSVNNIIINDKDLNNGILRVRYLNNKKLSNSLLKHDYKISDKMKKKL